MKLNVFNYSELHFSEVTSYKIPTLVEKLIEYRKVANSRLSVLVSSTFEDFHAVYLGEI